MLDHKELLECIPVAYVVTDAAGVIEEANGRARRLLRRERLVQNPLAMFVADSHREEFHAVLSRAGGAIAREVIDGAIELTPDGATPQPAPFSATVLADPVGDGYRICWMFLQATELERAKEALRRTEERMRAFVETAADGIITIDAHGTVQSFNAAAQRMFGYAEEEVVGNNVKLLMPEPHAEEHDDYLRRYFATGESKIVGISRELVGRRKDGTNLSMHLSVSKVGNGDTLSFTGIVRDLSEVKEVERRLAKAAIDERRHLAQDVHDRLGSQVAAIALFADLLLKALQEEGSSQVDLASELSGQVREAHGLLRQLSHGLFPVEVDDRGLMAALRRLTERFDPSREGFCELVCGQPVEVPDNFVANSLFFIAEEAVQNAIRHARADHVSVALTRGDDDSVILVVRDDGIGIDQPPAESTGMGLHTMKYRADLIDARLTVKRGDDGGTVVTCVASGRLAVDRNAGDARVGDL